MTDTKPMALRRLGHNEHFSSTRHHLGIYRCVVISCRYRNLPPGNPISPAFYAALASVVKAQPMLRVAIADEHTNAAYFAHVPEVDLRNHVFGVTVPCSTAEEYEARVAERQGWHHDQLWRELETRPPWRIAVLRPSGNAVQELQSQQDVFFAFHHSLMDGTSGKRFHEMLFAALLHQFTASSAPEPTYILPFPTPPSLPEAQEHAINFTLSLPFLLRALYDELAPSWLKPKPPQLWHGKDINLSLAYKTRVRPVDIPPEAVSSLLEGCRAHSSSLTALLHALVFASLATRLSASEASAFAASTPINLRPFTSPPIDTSLKDSLRTLISSLTHHFPPSTVSALRDQQPDISTPIWQTAQRIKSELNSKLQTIPHDDPMALLNYIADWFSFWRNKDGKPRAESWEVSNIGVLSNNVEPVVVRDAGFESCPRITRLLFTNGAMVAGPAIGVNVGSVAGSTLTIALSWQDTVVADEVVEKLAEDLAAYVSRYHETGKFSQ